MSELRRHIIHKQVIEVELPTSRSAMAMQDRIRNCFYDRLLPGLDKVFSSLVDEGVIIRIDQLTVDLGEVSEGQLEAQLTAKALEAVEKILKEKLRFEIDASDGVSAVPARKADVEILLFFLVEGRLPWWSPVNDLDRLEALIMEAGMLPAGFAARFLLAIGDAAVLRRLRFQFSRGFLRFLAAGCIPRFNDSAVDPAEALAAFIGGGAARASAGGPVAGESAGADARAGMDDVARAHGETTNGDGQSVLTDGQGVEDGPDGAGAGRGGTVTGGPGAEPGIGSDEGREGASHGAELPEEGSAGIVQNRDGRAAAGDDSRVGRGDWVTSMKELRGEGDREFRGDREPGGDKKLRGGAAMKEKALRDEEALYIELAGLVLLHPFVKPFFEALGLTEDRGFRDEACVHKAVHLLGYLATGETDIQEQRLILPKLFCGMAWSEPLERESIITQEERMEAENLLTAAIAHWKALKNASPGALQEAFLMREGRLTQTENGWQLDVEKKAQDILMGSMPWGVSVVKYPWMKTLLFVNWA